MPKARVYLVGAGPGDPQLITEKGLRLIQQADVILYDFLVHPNLLQAAKAHCELSCVGKKRGFHSSTQDDINALMIRHAKAGKTVLRLKGGDPFIFGRAGEEIEALIQANIAFECVPGVSSAIAVPEYAGIPLTHRDLSRSVAFVTGTLKKGQRHLDIPEADSIVFLMALSHLDAIIEKLLTLKRFNKQSRIAIISNGTRANQELVTGTLADSATLKAQLNNSSPALIIVGDTVALSKQYHWAKAKPLFGKRFILTRPKGQNETLAHALMAEGAEVIIAPAIRIEPIQAHLNTIDKQRLSTFTDIVFTSANSVKLVMTQLLTQNYDARAFSKLHIACIGNKTAEALKHYGLIADSIAKTASQQGLVDSLDKHLSHKRLFIPIAKEGSSLLKDACEKRGAYVEQVPIYKGQAVPINTALLHDSDIVILSSSSIANAFIKTLGPQASKLQLLAFGESTLKAIQAKQLQAQHLHSLSVDEILKLLT